MRVAPINTEESPIKMALGQHILSSPRTLTSVPVNDQVAYSTVRPGFIQSNTYANQSYAAPNQYTIRSTVLEPTRQFSTTQPYYHQQPSLVYTRPPITNTQLINYQTIQQSRSLAPIVTAPQSKVVEEIRVSRPVIELEPEVQTVVKYEYQEEPKVQLSPQTAWDSYYSRQKTLASPPPVAQAVAEQKTCCSPLLIGLLGLLALAGLITGIVLAAKAGSGFGNLSTNSQTPGVPVKNQTFVPPTNSTTGGNGTGNVTISKPNSTVVQPTIVNPIVVPPNVTGVIVTNSTTITTTDKITVMPMINTTEALPQNASTSTSSTSTSTSNSTSNSTSKFSGTSSNTSTSNSTNSTSTNTTASAPTTTTNTTKTTTTQSSFNATITQPSHKLKSIQNNKQQHKMRSQWA